VRTRADNRANNYASRAMRVSRLIRVTELALGRIIIRAKKEKPRDTERSKAEHGIARATPCRTVPCRAVPCRAVPRRAALCCAVRCNCSASPAAFETGGDAVMGPCVSRRVCLSRRNAHSSADSERELQTSTG